MQSPDRGLRIQVIQVLAEVKCRRAARELFVQALNEALAQGLSREEMEALIEDRVRAQWQR